MRSYFVIVLLAFVTVVLGSDESQEVDNSTLAVSDSITEVNVTEITTSGVVDNPTSTIATTTSTSTTTTKTKEPEQVKPILGEGVKNSAEEVGEKQDTEKPPQPTHKTDPSSSELEKLEKANDSNFLNIVLIGGFLSLAMYLVYHNKRKLMGVMFEGRGSGRNVRYRRLSQRDDDFPSEIIY